MADIARRRPAGFPAAEVLTFLFEDWRSNEAGFHAVVAVNLLHWVDPEVRYAKPHELIRPGCVMIVAGCLWVQPAGAERFWRVCRMTTGPWATRESCAAARADRTVISRPRPGPCSREVARLRYSPFQARYRAGTT